ncbi:MAG TPA: tail fiber protein [Saprospiraceae bacterium]|nr:tail fiber protein [Saprospiraceae bacterium]HMQ85309.1 tail fiber protein [Saprospiraceae bacterium]
MNQFLGQIQPFGFPFAPFSWAFCNGQLMAITSNEALFSLLGTMYGGDGQTTFGIPDLRGRIMLHQGSGPGINPVNIGEMSGHNNNTLTVANLPTHAHGIQLPVNNGAGGTDEPAGDYLAVSPSGDAYAANPGGNQFYGSNVNTAAVGSNVPFSIMQPYLVISVCIATEGIYPSRN